MLFFRAHLKACVHLVHFGLKNNVYTYILYWETVLMNTFCSRFLFKTLFNTAPGRETCFCVLSLISILRAPHFSFGINNRASHNLRM